MRDFNKPITQLTEKNILALLAVEEGKEAVNGFSATLFDMDSREQMFYAFCLNGIMTWPAPGAPSRVTDDGRAMIERAQEMKKDGLTDAKIEFMRELYNGAEYALKNLGNLKRGMARDLVRLGFLEPIVGKNKKIEMTHKAYSMFDGGQYAILR